MACENVTKYYSNDDVKFIITLTNAKNKAMAGQTVYVTINGVETAYVTDNEGRVSLDINNTLGKYDVYVEYREATHITLLMSQPSLRSSRPLKVLM